jgi:hypothetical protein
MSGLGGPWETPFSQVILHWQPATMRTEPGLGSIQTLWRPR